MIDTHFYKLNDMSRLDDEQSKELERMVSALVTKCMMLRINVIPSLAKESKLSESTIASLVYGNYVKSTQYTYRHIKDAFDRMIFWTERKN